MASRPPLRKQLTGAWTGPVDCGPRTVQMGVMSRLDNDWSPTIETIRRRMGRTGKQPTNVYNSEQAVDGWQPVKGRSPLRYYRRHSVQAVKDALRQGGEKGGKFVQVAIDYGTWRSLVKETGSTTFSGGHSIGLMGQKKWQDGTVVWLVFDPLEDGRRAGIKQGPVWRPRWKVIRAMEAFSGRQGRCYAGIFGGGQKA